MHHAFLIALGSIMAAIALAIAWQLTGRTRLRATERGAYLNAVLALFSDVQTRLTPSGFARMAGRAGGLSYDLQVVPDTLTFRKLPALWVLVTQTEPLPLTATLDLMMRPTLLEPFSNFRQLDHEIALPAGFPADAALRCDLPGAMPPETLLASQSDLFADPRIKELILSPKGLRVVFLAEQADRTAYLLFRDAEMGRQPLNPARIAPLLTRLATLRLTILRHYGAPDA